jgi:two-component system, OmpR family, phosphate regulon sensor histidine kinase PhoR
LKLGIQAKLVLISLGVLAPAFVLGYAIARRDLEASFPAAEAAALLERLSSLVALAAVLALVVVLVLSAVAAGIASSTARALAAAARKMADGDLATRAGPHGEDGFGELGAALDQLARGYSSLVAEHRSERERMRGVLEGMREGVLLLDRARRVTLVNPALREMLLLGADLEGKSPLEIIRHGELVRLLDEADDGEAAPSGEIDLGGLKPRRLLVHVVRIPGEEGGLLAVFVDVTHLRRLETLRKDFVANASHELRTPIAAISSAAETLEGAMTRDPEAAKDFVQMILRNAERLRNLVDDLLDLSRIESQDFAVRLEAVDTAEVAASVLELFHERAGKKGIRLASELSPGCRAFADRRGLEHVLTNLIDNAVKYCVTGSTVTVSAQPSDASVRIDVQDDGPGIEREHLPRLFERFYRVDPGRSREIGGTGLGLSIVKHLVEAMRGSIGVESEPGKGTRFTVRLKAAEPDQRIRPTAA